MLRVLAERALLRGLDVHPIESDLALCAGKSTGAVSGCHVDGLISHADLDRGLGEKRIIVLRRNIEVLAIEEADEAFLVLVGSFEPCFSLLLLLLVKERNGL